MKTAVEMPGYGQRGKTESRFSSLPTALGNRCRDSHIPTAATKPWKSGKPKSWASHFPTARRLDMED